MRLNFLLLFVLVINMKAFSQTTIETLEKKLTDSTSKQWTGKGQEAFFGDACGSGTIVYNFVFNERNVTRNNCENNPVKTLDVNWKIVSEGSIFYIEFSDKSKYEIQFVRKQNNPNIYLRLRGKPKKSKSLQMVDYYLTSN